MKVKHQIYKARVQEINYNNEFPCINAMKDHKINITDDDEFVEPNNWNMSSGKPKIMYYP